MSQILLKKIKLSIFSVCLVLVLGVFLLVLFDKNTPITIAEELGTGELSKQSALSDLSSIPAVTLEETEAAFVVEDAKENRGVSIEYAGSKDTRIQDASNKKETNHKTQTTNDNSPFEGGAPDGVGAVTTKEAGDADSTDNFKISFSKEYNQGITVDLGQGRSFIIQDNDNEFYEALVMTNTPSVTTVPSPPKGAKLEGADTPSSFDSPPPGGSTLEEGAGGIHQQESKYLRYQSPDERKNIYYAYQKDGATGERKLKKWIVYEECGNSLLESTSKHFSNSPLERSTPEGGGVSPLEMQINSGLAIGRNTPHPNGHPSQEGNCTEREEYSFESAKLQLNDNGDVEVFYWGDKEQQNELTMAEVDEGLLARAQRVLAKDMGEDYMKNGQPDLIIPKAFYYDKDNNLTYLEWEISEDGHSLSLEFEVIKDQYPIALDPTLEFTAPGIPEASDVITGEHTGDYFGGSVVVGDLNNDGQDDLVVGAYGYNRVYVFYQDGGLGDMAYMADEIIIGESGSFFGYSLDSGDLDADGDTDLVVGAYGYDSNTGQVYVIYNDGAYPSEASSSDVIIAGESFSYRFGYALSSGDYDADGDTDLAVTAYTVSSDYGQAYIFYNDGSYPSNTSGADEAIIGDNNSYFGHSLGSGDLDGDGDDDLVVGAYAYSNDDDTGRVYIFYNDGEYPSSVSSADEIITGEDEDHEFGDSLAVGDLDADGDMDLVVGADKYDLVANEGRVYIFYNDGSYPSDAANADETITGESLSYFAGSLAIGDLNNDGRDDLIVGAERYDILDDEGRVYIFYNDGSYTATSSLADVIITGEESSGFGNYLASGDLNSDGNMDLIVGAKGYNSNQGRAYIFYSQNGQVNLNTSIVGETEGDYFGSAMTSGDFDADGDIDLAVGAYGYNSNQGRVYIFYNDYSYGTSSTLADEVITGESAGNYFGYSLEKGDLDADGDTDLVVGAYGYDSNTGQVYIFYNDGAYPVTAITADELIVGEGSGDDFGKSFNAGDLDNDGDIDLAVGAPRYNTGQGRVYIFYNDGSGEYAYGATTSEVTITGEGGGYRFGSLVKIGDMDAGGTMDLVVSAYRYTGSEGAVYIFYNDGVYSASAGLADERIVGSSFSFFGGDMVLGDFNNNGKTDLVVTGYFAGKKVYIFYNDGSYAGSAESADEIITGESPYFAPSLAGGDLNNDGATDLILGSTGYDISANEGRVYIYFNDGSYPTTATGADIMITGEDIDNGNFGSSLIIDDFNNNGKDDLIVGAMGINSNTGKIYFYETRDNYSWDLQPQLENDFRILNHGGAELKITGERDYNRFGSNTLLISDLNNDGKEDLIVGAYEYNVGIGSGEGRVYIFYNDGSYSPSATQADVVITGESGSNLGYSFVVGDFDNDGKNDLMVGAHVYNSTQGRVYVFYNDGAYPALAADADVAITGESGSSLGQYMTSGDLDADGDMDLVLGGYFYNGGQGRVYILYNDGSYPDVVASADVIISGESESLFSLGLTTGDVNADSKIDLIVGGPYYNSVQGRVYVFYNDGAYPALATDADEIITGETNSQLGEYITSGDLDSDGDVDIIVSAYSFDLGTRTNEGRVYIFYNDGAYPTTAGLADELITGETDSKFGSSLTVGDLNRDGKSDLVVGASGHNSYQGRAYVFYNDGTGVYPWGASSSDIILTGENVGDQYSGSLAVGDLNNDGKDDLAIGAAYNGSIETGRVYLYTFNDQVISGEDEGDGFGYSMASGDLNNDGKNDLVVGAFYYNGFQGRVYIFYNDSILTNSAGSADELITGEASSLFGSSLVVDDLDADGDKDLVVGAQYYNSYQGRVYIFYNDGDYPSQSSSAEEVITGEGSGDSFGISLATGDMDADGDVDLVVGASKDSAYKGKAYIFYNDGAYPSLASLADEEIIGEITNGHFGEFLTTGDLDADGDIDLAVSAHYKSLVYIFYNDGIYTSLAESADEIIRGENSSDLFGASLAIGDLDADGDDDLVVGSSGYDSSNGRIYIFYNAANSTYPYGATSSDVIISGETGSRFGGSLRVGDLNQDAKVDLIVGGTSYNSDQGRAYIFYNDGVYPVLASGADIKLTGKNTGDYFGDSMLIVDLNLDGINDLLVGASGYNSSQGRVYLYTNETKVVSGYQKAGIKGGATIKGDVIFR